MQIHLKLHRLLVFIALAASPGLVRAESFSSQLVSAAIERTSVKIRYDDSYFYIPYPNGDVPPGIGVCTDVIVRTYRALGVDLQKLVHEDMSRNFSLYPSERIWSLTKPDPNIDHRRVPNLEVFFSRFGEVLPISHSPKDYQAGDIVTWRMRSNRPHIGIITDLDSPSNGTPLIVHNIGKGPQLDGILFNYKIAGHYRYIPQQYKEDDSTTKKNKAPDHQQLFRKEGEGYVLDEELLKKLFPEETGARK
ncbi:hypothetical protein SAMN02745866_03975 [Alteromonadaceae bacterium Bs31]|nr:hypothetical protein SAMN02745866_03975 [Alteromonadaceae bacterium Bs31]